MQGIVIKYDRVRGFGFILPDDQTLSDFFVAAPLIDSPKRFLLVGQRVEFVPDIDLKGRPVAAHVVALSPYTLVRQTSGSAVQS